MRRRHSNSGRRAFELFRILVPVATQKNAGGNHGNLRVSSPPPSMPSHPRNKVPEAKAQFLTDNGGESFLKASFRRGGGALEVGH